VIKIVKLWQKQKIPGSARKQSRGLRETNPWHVLENLRGGGMRDFRV
jgi:hypothetical protein